jgi:hypothetical protein
VEEQWLINVIIIYTRVEKAKRILIKILINLNIINKNIKGFN